MELEQIDDTPPGGPQVVELGTYEEIVPSRLLVVDMKIEGSSENELTRLRVEFMPSAGGTLISVDLLDTVIA